MNSEQQQDLDPRDIELLRKIEELRARLLGNEEVRERISLHAYELYHRRGGEHGRDIEDWVEAENEVLSPLIEQELRLSVERIPTQGVERSIGKAAERRTEAGLTKQSKSRTRPKSDTAAKRKKSNQATVVAAQTHVTEKTRGKRTAKGKSSRSPAKGKKNPESANEPTQGTN